MIEPLGFWKEFAISMGMMFVLVLIFEKID